MNLLQQLEAEQMATARTKALPDFRPGDTLKVNVKVVDVTFDEKTKQNKTRERIQAFEGVCIARQGSGLNEAFTVRKLSYGEGVERVFPIYSPLVDSVVVVRKGKVRRAKLYYLRGRTGKKARILEKGAGASAAEMSEADLLEGAPTADTAPAAAAKATPKAEAKAAAKAEAKAKNEAQKAERTAKKKAGRDERRAARKAEAEKKSA